MIPSDWGRLNAEYIVKMKRADCHGKHVFAKGGLEAYQRYFGEDVVREILEARSKL